MQHLARFHTIACSSSLTFWSFDIQLAGFFSTKVFLDLRCKQIHRSTLFAMTDGSAATRVSSKRTHQYHLHTLPCHPLQSHGQDTDWTLFHYSCYCISEMVRSFHLQLLSHPLSLQMIVRNRANYIYVIEILNSGNRSHVFVANRCRSHLIATLEQMTWTTTALYSTPRMPVSLKGLTGMIVGYAKFP